MYVFPKKASFYGELLSPCPTSKLKDTPCWLSTTADSIYLAATLHTGGCSSIRNPRTHHAEVTDPLIMDHKLLQYTILFLLHDLCTSHSPSLNNNLCSVICVPWLLCINNADAQNSASQSCLSKKTGSDMPLNSG